MSDRLAENAAGIPVFQFVAWSGTGKTTFLEKLIRELRARGLRVCAYKHDGHEFEIDTPGKDSWRMTQAGADVTVLSSAGKAVIMENRFVDPGDLIDRIEDVDLILVEGWKAGPWPRIALRRKASGKDFPVDPAGCLAVITDTPCAEARRSFGFDEAAAVADLLGKYLK